MNKQEIKDLVAAKIAGQGSMVDIGGALPQIINAIVDAIPEGGGSEPLIVEGAFSGIPRGIKFEPTDGTTIEQAHTAFMAGRRIVMKDSTFYSGAACEVSGVFSDDAGYGTTIIGRMPDETNVPAEVFWGYIPEN